MQIEVKVPQLSESVSEATLLAWHKQPGQRVERDENLVDIETDKVVLETPAPAAGVLVSVTKTQGSQVGSGEIIAVIDTELASASADAGSVLSDLKTAPPAKPAAQGSVAAKAAPAASPQSSNVSTAMPAARKAAAEKKVELASVKGTGRGGRITKGDVLKAVEAPAPAAPRPTPAPQAAPGGRAEERVPMSRLRARIAERLVESKRDTATLTTFNEVNMRAVIELRARYKESFEREHGIKLGFMSFFVKAAVAALRKFPIVNASVDGTDILYHGYYDIGIAVSTPRGLVVPVLRDADRLSLAGIEKQIADFAARARDGKLGIEELTGGTFSISNGGVFGSVLSTPIINPPQSAILGVHATQERPVAENGQVVIRPMCWLALSYDHRIIDGREAVQALVAVKDALEDPARLLLDV